MNDTATYYEFDCKEAYRVGMILTGDKHFAGKMLRDAAGRRARPVKLMCLRCDTQPFTVTAGEVHDAGGYIECEYCGTKTYQVAP